MRDKGVKHLYGVEYDKAIVDYNRNVLDITMIDPNEFDKIESESFDIIRAIHTIEHLPDPYSVLSTFFRILKGDGIVVISTPCFSDALVSANIIKIGKIMVYPDHLFYFTKRSMSALLTNLGFSVEINISQFANRSQALDVLGARADFEDNKFENIVKDLEELGAGANSFVVARKTMSEGSLKQGENNSGICIYTYTLQKQRGSYYSIKQQGSWQILFPINRDAVKRRMYVSGNIINLHSTNAIKTQLINSV